MDAIKELTQINYGTLIIAICTILLSFKFMWTLFDWFIKLLGLETRSMRQKREEHELLIVTVQNLKELQKKQEEDVKQSIQHDKRIKDDIKNLSNMFVDLEIQDIRWNILNFCSDLSNGKNFSNEYYDYVFKLYDKYEKMLRDNGLTNGLIEQSISYIREKYRESLNKEN